MPIFFFRSLGYIKKCLGGSEMACLTPNVTLKSHLSLYNFWGGLKSSTYDGTLCGLNFVIDSGLYALWLNLMGWTLHQFQYIPSRQIIYFTLLRHFTLCRWVLSQNSSFLWDVSLDVEPIRMHMWFVPDRLSTSVASRILWKLSLWNKLEFGIHFKYSGRHMLCWNSLWNCKICCVQTFSPDTREGTF